MAAFVLLLAASVRLTEGYRTAIGDAVTAADKIAVDEVNEASTADSFHPWRDLKAPSWKSCHALVGNTSAAMHCSSLGGRCLKSPARVCRCEYGVVEDFDAPLEGKQCYHSRKSFSVHCKERYRCNATAPSHDEVEEQQLARQGKGLSWRSCAEPAVAGSEISADVHCEGFGGHCAKVPNRVCKCHHGVVEDPSQAEGPHCHASLHSFSVHCTGRYRCNTSAPLSWREADELDNGYHQAKVPSLKACTDGIEHANATTGESHCAALGGFCAKLGAHRTCVCAEGIEEKQDSPYKHVDCHETGHSFRLHCHEKYHCRPRDPQKDECSTVLAPPDKNHSKPLLSEEAKAKLLRDAPKKALEGGKWLAKKVETKVVEYVKTRTECFASKCPKAVRRAWLPIQEALETKDASDAAHALADVTNKCNGCSFMVCKNHVIKWELKALCAIDSFRSTAEVDNLCSWCKISSMKVSDSIMHKADDFFAEQLAKHQLRKLAKRRKSQCLELQNATSVSEDETQPPQEDTD